MVENCFFFQSSFDALVGDGTKSTDAKNFETGGFKCTIIHDLGIFFILGELERHNGGRGRNRWANCYALRFRLVLHSKTKVQLEHS